LFSLWPCIGPGAFYSIMCREACSGMQIGLGDGCGKLWPTIGNWTGALVLEVFPVRPQRAENKSEGVFLRAGRRLGWLRQAGQLLFLVLRRARQLGEARSRGRAETRFCSLRTTTASRGPAAPNTRYPYPIQSILYIRFLTSQGVFKHGLRPNIKRPKI
jgi:hypothetical protein